MNDRTYWRQCSTKSLIEHARYSDNELTIALGERLDEFEATDDALYDLQKESLEQDRRIDALMARIAELEAQLDWVD